MIKQKIGYSTATGRGGGELTRKTAWLASLLSIVVLASQGWTVCTFSDPQASMLDDQWHNTSSTRGEIVFYEGSVGAGSKTVSLPTVADPNDCTGSGASVSYQLYESDGTTAVSAAGSGAYILIEAGDFTANDGSHVSLDSGLTTVTHADGPGEVFYNNPPKTFVLKASKAFADGDVAEFEFSVTVRPARHIQAPSNAYFYSETATSIYLEWSGDGKSAGSSDTTATHYRIDYSYTSAGLGAMPVRRSVRVSDTAEPGTNHVDSLRQSHTLTGLQASTTYEISVTGVSGTGYATRESGAYVYSNHYAAGSLATRTPHFNPSLVPDNPIAQPFKISVGETVDINVHELIYVALAGVSSDPTNAASPNISDQQGRGTVAGMDAHGNSDPRPTFTFAVAGGNSNFLQATYIDDADVTNADDLLRLTGLADTGNGRETVTITATTDDGQTTLMGQMQVRVLENYAPAFTISEATVEWNVGTDMGNDPFGFEIDVVSGFVTDQIVDANSGVCSDDDASNDINCDHEVTFTMSESEWFEIDGSMGVISVKSTVTSLEAVQEGDQYELVVTATDQSGASDTMTIFVDVVNEQNDAPKKLGTATDIWLQPLTEANEGGTRTARELRSKFSDEENDDLCFEIRDQYATDTATGSAYVDASGNVYVDAAGDPIIADAEGNKIADASLRGSSSCSSDRLTITMRLPSSDPDDDNFGLLGKYGKETATVEVGAYERGTTPKVEAIGTVRITVHLVYGQNSSPSIRTTAKVTGSNTYVASGGHAIDEGGDIKLTFTADDGSPSGDELCWSWQGSCGPCTGNPSEAPLANRNLDNPSLQVSDRSVGAAHEYELVINGTSGSTRRTDYESTNGTYTIDLCATDLAGETHNFDFDVMLNDVEEAPMLANINSLYMVVGDWEYEIDLADYASDGDGEDDIVEYEAECRFDCDAVTVDEQNGIVTITPTEEEIGSSDVNDEVEAEIEASVRDSTGRTAYTTFFVTVKDRNVAPVYGGGLRSVSYSMQENSTNHIVGEPLSITDQDDDEDSLTVSTNTEEFTATRVVTSAANASETTYGIEIRTGSGPFNFESDAEYNFTVAVEDRYGGHDSIDVQVELTDVNEPPTIVEGSGDIMDQRILVGMYECMVDASQHFEDEDQRDQDSGLLIEAETTRPAYAQVEVEDKNEICVTGLAKGRGRVKVTASDREGLQVRKKFRLVVDANQMPTVENDGIPDQTMEEMGRIEAIDLNKYFDDGDLLYEEELKFEVEVDDNEYANASIIGGDKLRIYGETEGTTTVTVTATDEDDQDVSDSFEVEVTRNDPPVANPDAIEDIETRIGLEVEPIDVSEAFTDEGDVLSYSVETDNPDVATAALDYEVDAPDDEEGPWIIVHLHEPGTTKCTLTATDTAGNTAEVEFTIEVGARNDAPTVANYIEDVILEEGDRHDVELDDVFEDEGSLDIEIENTDDDVADVIYRESANEIRIYANMAGTTTVTVTATDNVGQTATDEFEVTVEAVPEAVGAIANQTLQIGGEDLDLNVSEYFSYTDGVELLSYTVTTDGSNAATITNIGSLLTMAPYTRGETEVTVTATDPRGRTAVQAFTTFVSDSELRAVAQNALAGYARAYVGTVSSVIGSRLESNRSDEGISMGRFAPFAQFAPIDDFTYSAGTEFSANGGVAGFGQVANQSTHTSTGTGMDLGAINLKSVVNVSHKFSKMLNGKGGIGSWSLWSTRDARSFSGEGYEGTTSTTFMGLDLLANKHWMVGVTASRNKGMSEYSWGTATQSMDTELLSVLPYFSFEPNSKTSLWGVVGYGIGDIASTVVNADSQSSDLSMNMGMLGGRHEFAKIGILDLAVRGDAAFANLATGAGSGAVDDLSANVNRLRAGLESTLSIDLHNGRSIQPFGEVSFRNDGGDGLTGSGVELGGGVRVQTNAFTFEVRGHKTASHSAEDFSESGFSIQAEIAPSTDGSGFALQMAPRWIQSTGVQPVAGGIWSDASTSDANRLHQMQSYVGHVDSLGNPLLESREGMSFDTALKYGFRINNDRYLVTPFVEAQSYGAGTVSSLVGFEFKQLVKASRSVDMRFVIAPQDDGSYGSNSQIGVNARILF